jgi:hypothetical protein
MKGTLTHRDGHWCFQHQYVDMTRPIVISMTWKLHRNLNADAELEGVEAAFNTNDFGATLSYRVGRWSGADWRTEHLPAAFHSRTKCDWLEEVPVPCPKVKAGTETRWHAGRWQKYLKTKGWVTA